MVSISLCHTFPFDFFFVGNTGWQTSAFYIFSHNIKEFFVLLFWEIFNKGQICSLCQSFTAPPPRVFPQLLQIVFCAKGGLPKHVKKRLKRENFLLIHRSKHFPPIYRVQWENEPLLQPENNAEKS